VGKGQLGRGGIVRDETRRQEALQRTLRFAADIGLRALKTLDSPLKGKKGNLEILAIFELPAPFHAM
jgi:23S rRNA (cytidine1920-2'-O)/16S rRNA (cytidine1409-2'-O)-methyltransferase